MERLFVGVVGEVCGDGHVGKDVSAAGDAFGEFRVAFDFVEEGGGAEFEKVSKKI
jgi:hypothetical protein